MNYDNYLRDSGIIGPANDKGPCEILIKDA